VHLVVLFVPGDVVPDFELLCHALTFPAGTGVSTCQAVST
jgi:hypothetical protein